MLIRFQNSHPQQKCGMKTEVSLSVTWLMRWEFRLYHNQNLQQKIWTCKINLKKSVPFLLNDKQNRIIKFLARSRMIMFLHAPYLRRSGIVRLFPFTRTHIGIEGWILWHSHDSITGLHKTQDFTNSSSNCATSGLNKSSHKRNTWNGTTLDSK
jgi:hypothetical protein